jgi:hypothetical protein
VERCPLDGGRIGRAGRDPRLGTSFANRFLVERLIAEGHLGRVYHVRHHRRRAALLVFHGDLAADALTTARFAREAALLERQPRSGGLEFGVSDEGVPFLAVPDPTKALVAALAQLQRPRDLSPALEGRRRSDASAPLRRPARRHVRIIALAVLATLAAVGSAGAAALL